MVALLLVLALGLGGQALAGLAERDAAFTLLTEKSSKKRIAGVEALAASGDPSAAAVLAAMAGGDLYFTKSDKQIVIAERDGKLYRLTDPISGVVVGEGKSSKIKKVRVNNRLRRMIRGALGGLNLSHPDPAKRLAAAEALIKSPDPALRGTLAGAFEKEQDKGVKTAMELALAVVVWLSVNNHGLDNGVDSSAACSCIATLFAAEPPHSLRLYRVTLTAAESPYFL